MKYLIAFIIVILIIITYVYTLPNTPTDSSVQVAVTNPENYPVNANDVVTNVLKDDSSIWNPQPYHANYTLQFIFNKPVKISGFYIQTRGDVTHDVSTINASATGLNQLFNLKSGSKDLQQCTFTTPIVSDKIVLVAHPTTQWQIYIQRIKFF